MSNKKHILFTFLVFSFFSFLGQENIISQKGVEFPVRITVVDEDYNKITNNVEIFINGTFYRRPDFVGRYIVRAKVDDELRVSHPDFQTVYYTLTSSEDIKVVVKDYIVKRKKYSKKISKTRNTDFYLQYIDSVKLFKEKDIEKSLSFIEKALKNKENEKRTAVTYKLLADVYFYWKQYDLAVYNYELSNQINKEVKDRKSVV